LIIDQQQSVGVVAYCEVSSRIQCNCSSSLAVQLPTRLSSGKQQYWY